MADASWGGSQLLSGGYEYERESDPLNPSFLVENNAFFVQQQFKAQDRWLASVGVRLELSPESPSFSDATVDATVDGSPSPAAS